MYVSDGIAYAENSISELSISDIRPDGNLCMIVTFDSGEQVRFNATELVEKPAFRRLKDDSIFSHPRIDHGVCTWDEGKVDLSPAYIYRHGSRIA